MQLQICITFTCVVNICFITWFNCFFIKIKQKENSPILKYSPPSYNSFGISATQSDPFERNTVEVRESPTGFGEGLFTKRKIEKGEFLSFYSGYFITIGTINPFERRNMSGKELYELSK